MAQQTAVEWLLQRLILNGTIRLTYTQHPTYKELSIQAKEMEKEQMIKFANDFVDDCDKRSVSFYYLPHLTPEEFYTETYRK